MTDRPERVHNACPNCRQPITGTQGGRRKSPLDVPNSKRIEFYRNEPCGCIIDAGEWTRTVGGGLEGTMNVTWIKVR